MEDIMNLIDLLSHQSWAAAGGTIAAIFVTMLTNRAKFLPTWDSPWRTVLGTVCAAVGMGLNQAQNGSGAMSLVVGALVTASPTLVAELVAALHAKSPKPPVGPALTALMGLTFALSFVFTGCATFSKQDAKTVVDVTKALVEEICSPDDPSLDACLDKLLSARLAARAVAADAGADR